MLDSCVREVLQETSPRVFAVLDPLKVTVSNWPEDKVEDLRVPFLPPSKQKKGDLTSNVDQIDEAPSYRNLTFRKHLLIDRRDFRDSSRNDGNFFGLTLHGKVRRI